MNVAHLLLRGRDVAAGAAAWRYGERSAAYSTLIDRAARLAAGLARTGLRPGDRVVIDLPNSPDLLEMLWACFWGGYVAVPVNWHLHPKEVAHVTDDCAASAILLGDQTGYHADALRSGVHVIGAGGIPLDDVLADTGSTLWEVSGEEPAWLFYTSGTTGRPKGATLSHRNLLAMTLNYYADLDQVAPGSVFVHAAPLSHGSGLYLLPATGHGATNVIAATTSFDPVTFLDLVGAVRATHVAFLAPTMLNRLVAATQPTDPRLADLRSVVVGGAPFYREDLIRAQECVGPIITQMYGQGEAPMTISVLPPAEATEVHFASCGRPFTGVALRVIDPLGRDLPTGTSGEVAVRGDVVMSGYWNNPDATSETLRGGWLHTGDVGHVDDGGYLYLTDRAKDVIMTGGSNVYPREVEEVLLSYPGVREVAVIGEPDPEWGEAICAVVVLEPDIEVDAAELVSHCRGHLASFKKPRRVVFTDELPKNATGKVLKRDLRLEMAGRP